MWSGTAAFAGALQQPAVQRIEDERFHHKRRLGRDLAYEQRSFRLARASSAK